MDNGKSVSYINHTVNGFTFLTSPTIAVTHTFSAGYGKENDGKFSDESMTALCNALNISPDNVVYNKQVHGNDVRVIKQPVPDSVVEADALITNVPGIALMVLSADCVPILLYDPVCSAVGAIHAGWRGTAKNIVVNTVNQMQNNYGSSPADIRAAIGPCISVCCFESDADVCDALQEVLLDKADSCIAVHPKINGKYMIDLKEANRILLIGAGLSDKNIAISDDCTVCTDDGNKYWSHRRQGKERGSQAAVIVNKIGK